VSGTRAFAYVPYPGEEMNVLLAGEAGTSSTNAFTIGERLKCEKATGKWILEGTSANWAPFMCMEHLDEVPDVDTLCWVQKQF